MKTNQSQLNPACWYFASSRVQKCADLNQMCTKNLALLFAPSLFQTDGKGEHEVKIMEDLIDHYLHVFDVSSSSTTISTTLTFATSATTVAMNTIYCLSMK